MLPISLPKLIDDYKIFQKLYNFKSGKIEHVQFAKKEISAEKIKNDHEIKYLYVKVEDAFITEEKFKKEIEDLKNSNEKIEANFEKVISEFHSENDLKSKFQSQEILINQLKNVNDVVKFHSKDSYDLVININSLHDLKENNGWKIKFPNESSKAKFEQYNIEESTVIGVIGIFNKGKSFILQKLSNQEISHGYSIKTEGLSIKYPTDKNNPVTVLDTAGFETPIEIIPKKMNKDTNETETNLNETETINNDDIWQNILRDRAHTEIFLQKYIIKYSSILLIVVGILTFSDQKLINRLKVYGDKKKLVVIHNLQTYSTTEEVESYIKYTLEETFKVKKMVITEQNETDERRNFYYQEVANKESEISHLILAKEGTNAGDKYNSSSFNFLNYIIKAYANRQVFNPLENLKSHLFDLSREIFEKDFQEKIKSPDNIVIKNDNIFIEGANKIELTKCYIDELGISNVQSSGFLPDHSITKISNDQLEVKLDIPDLKSLEIMEIETRGQNNYELTIKGKKKEDVESKDSLLNNRKKGDFILVLKISKESLNFANLNPVSRKYENGVVRIFYDLVKKTEKKMNTLSFD